MKLIPILSLAILAAGLAGCATQEEAPSAEEPLTVEEVLATTLGDDAYGETTRCVSRHLVNRTEVLDDKHILFWGRGDRVWLNTLRSRCVGMRPRDTLQLEVRDNQICNFDMVSTIERFGAGFMPVSARCGLGDFVEINKEQAQVLVEELRR